MIKFIADVNVERQLVDFLTERKYDVLWIPDYDCTLTDDKLLQLANMENRILITNDTDFGKLVFNQKMIITGIVLVRIKDQDVKKKLKSLKKILSLYEEKLKNNFIVITENRIRIKSMEKKDG